MVGICEIVRATCGGSECVGWVSEWSQTEKKEMKF